MALTPGETILNGKYRILRLVGEGGMARVWLADEPAVGRQVAIKEIKREALSPLEAREVEDRFAREMRIGGKLFEAEVPNIVRAITTEKLNGDTLLVMEYMPGGSLADRLQGGPLPVDEAVEITVQLLEALASVHEQLGLVHRDIKPSNILFTADGRAKLADFGLAQTTESGRSLGAGRAHPGTPGYMCPEQARETGYLLPSCDLYALGCVLFEMLTGRKYQDCRPGTKASSLRSEVSAWLDDVLAKALADDPWSRYESANEMTAALTARPMPKPAPRPTREPITPHPRRGYRALLAAFAVVVVVALAAGLWLGGVLGGDREKPTPTVRGTQGTDTPVSTSTLPKPTATPPPAPTPTVPASQFTAGQVVRISTMDEEGIRFRSGPGLDYVTVDVLEEGTELKVLEGPVEADGYVWWRLEMGDGTIGWGPEDWLRPLTQSPAVQATQGAATPALTSTLPKPTATRPPVPTSTVPASQLAAGQMVRISGTDGEGLRVRTGPGLDYVTLEIWEEGTELQVLEGPQVADGFVWWRLEMADGTIGWLPDEWLQIVPTATKP